MTNLHTRLVTLAAITILAVFGPAQVPEGHGLVGTFYLNGGTPGLFGVDPETAVVTEITGLPAELTAQVQYSGTWSVALRSSDGAVIVGTLSGGDVNVHVMQLNGTAVTTTDTIYVGSASTGAGGARVQVLSENLIYVAAFEQVGALPLATGPLAATGHGIIDTSVSPPTLSPLPAVTGFPNAGLQTGGLVLDPTGGRFYQLFYAPFVASAPGAYLMSFDLASFSWCTVANWPNEGAQGLVIDDDGTVHVSATIYGAGQNHVMHSLRPDGCNAGPITTVPSSVAQNTNALAMDRRSGNFLLGTINGGAVVGSTLSSVDPVTGEVTLITAGLDWGRIGAAGVAVNDVIESYGNVSDGQNRYSFANFPNPGGQPSIGNAGFSLTLAATPGAPLLSVLGLSFGRGLLTAAGIDVLLDLNTAVALTVPAGLSTTYALPIPVDPSLVDTEITAQSVHLEASGNLAASRGLSFLVAAMPEPIISSVTPSAAPAGTTVTVLGDHFFAGLQLQIGGNATAIVSQSEQSLTFVMPPGVGCDTPLTLTSLGGSTTTTINATPLITSSTSSTPAAGGGLLVITGTNLNDATVTVAGNPITVLSQTDVLIVGYSPASVVGWTTLVVSNPNGCQASVPILLF